MRLLSLVIIFLFAGHLEAQIPVGYVQFVDFNKGADGATNIKTTREGYLILGNGSGTADNNFDYPSKLEMLVLNKAGVIIKQNELGIDSVVLGNGLSGSLLMLNDTTFMSLGYYRDYRLASNDVDPFFTFYNQHGDTLKTVRWRHVNMWSIPHFGVLTSDSTIAITGVYGPMASFPSTILYKTDLDLNLQWQKLYPTSGYDAGYTLVQLPDKKLMIGSGQGNLSTYNVGRLINVDTAGNMNWQKFYGHTGLNCNIALLRMEDNNLYGVHCLDTVINTGDADMPTYVFQADLKGNMLWRLFFNKPDYVSPWNFKAASDTTFLLTGQYLYGGIGSHLPDVGYAAMIDTAGNLLWERLYDFPDSLPNFAGILHDFVITEDQGILFAGQAAGIDPIQNSNFWIMKTDSLGCLVLGCDTFNTGTANPPPVFSDHLLRVYPNPATEQINVQLELDRPAKNITGTLYNLQGHEIYTLQGSGWNLIGTIPLDGLPTGIYLLHCTADGRHVATEKVVVE